MEMTQPYQMLKLIRSANISGNKIVGNNYQSSINSVSLLGTPELSGLALSIYDTVANTSTFTYDYSTTLEGVIPFFDKLNRNIKYKPLYRLFQSVVIESFSLVYSLENFSDYVPNFTQKDANRVHNNIHLIINNLYSIDDPDTYTVILSLRELDNNIMYLYTTFSGLDYSYSSSIENNYSKINLVPDSEFVYLNDFWKINKVYDGTSSGNIKDYVAKYESGLSFISQSVSGVDIETTVIPIYSDTRVTLRAKTKNTIKLYAVDSDGNTVRFVDEFGNRINNGLLGESKVVSDGIQVLKGVYIPGGVTYVKIVIGLFKPSETKDDTINELMMSYGYNIGNYVRSTIYDLQ